MMFPCHCWRRRSPERNLSMNVHIPQSFALPRSAAPALLALLILVPGAARAARPGYPVTAVHAVTDTLHGVPVEDPYRWLEDSSSPDVQKWTDAQNALTRSTLDAFLGRAALRQRMEKLFAITVESSPSVYGHRYFFTRREALQNHAVVFVREGGAKAPPKMVLDPNQ